VSSTPDGSPSGIPIFVVLGLATDALAALADLASPGVLDLLALLLIAGILATAATAVVAYVGALVTYRVGWDPDNNGVPMVSSASDFLSAVALMLSLAVLGLT
jgi:mgtE-like transporter